MGRTLLIILLVFSLALFGWATIHAVDMAYQIAMILFFGSALSCGF